MGGRGSLIVSGRAGGLPMRSAAAEVKAALDVSLARLLVARDEPGL